MPNVATSWWRPELGRLLPTLSATAAIIAILGFGAYLDRGLNDGNKGNVADSSPVPVSLEEDTTAAPLGASAQSSASDTPPTTTTTSSPTTSGAEFNLEVLGPQRVKVSWPRQVHEETIYRYQVLWGPTDESERPRDDLTENADELSLVLEDLAPETEYEVSVRVCIDSDGGCNDVNYYFATDLVTTS